jgi:Ni/Co efflux regulator RcnB
MNRVSRITATSLLSILLSGGLAVAQDHHDDDRDNHHYVHHDEWKKGHTIRHEDWDRGERVDCHRYHLQEPPKGHEWRLIDGNWVLGEISTGRISTVVVARF